MHQIRLENYAFEGDNNVYCFDDGPETVLVDTGDWIDDTERDLRTALAKRDLSFAAVDRVLLTHWHGDHVGLASTIQDESGCSVHIHEADAPLVAGDDDAWTAMGAQHRENFESWHMPAEKRAVLEELFSFVPIREDPPDVTPLQDGDQFTVNDLTLTAVHAPGHAAGLCLFEITGDGRRDVLTGDALLPKYTPNVGGADVRVDRPLANYLRTLRAIVDADYDRAWPGHRDRIDDPTGRAAEIIRHHERRAYRVLDALNRIGPTDVWSISADLFGELESIHILHGPGETYAHLEHLEANELVVLEDTIYSLSPGVADRLEELADRPETERVWDL